jgi:hypothetical protein
LPRRTSLLLCVALALSGGCDRHSTITRLRTLPSAATQFPAASAGALDEDLNPRLFRRFAAISRLPQSPDSALVPLDRLLDFEPLLSRTGKGTTFFFIRLPIEAHGSPTLNQEANL